MQVFRQSILTCVIVLAASAASAGELPSAVDLARFGLKMTWWARAAVDPGRETVDFVNNDEETVFVRSSTGIISAFDAETGRKLWSNLYGRPDQISYPPVSNANDVLVAVGIYLICIDKKNGDLLWELKLPKHPSAPPAVDDDQAYIGMVDGSVYCFDLNLARQLHEQRRLPEFSHVCQMWRYQTPSEIVSPPISTNRSVCFASSSGSFYSVATKGQKLIFQFESDAPIYAPIGRDQNSILIASENSRLYCLNQDNGQFRWAFTSAHPIRQQPRFFGKRVYVTPQTVGTYALNADNGSEIWPLPQGQLQQLLMVGQNRVYGFNAQRELVVVDATDGKPVGKLPLRKYNRSPTNDRTDRLILASQEGLVVCLKEQNSGIPTYHLYPERRPILPELTPEEGAEETIDDAMTTEGSVEASEGAMETEEATDSEEAMEAPADEESM